jgi:hypothetical protein
MFFELFKKWAVADGEDSILFCFGAISACVGR